MKHAVITGPTGAIGVALIEKLIQEGVRISAVCRPGSERIKGLPKNDLLKIIECDVSDLLNLPRLIKEKCDIFYHFAWKGTVGDARNDMNLQVQNIKFAVDAVEAAKKLGCKTFIGAGSQGEYGRVSGVLHANTPVKPENGYGMAKLCAGQMTKVLCQKYHIRHIWTRILSVYGPHDGKKTMIISAMNSLIKGQVPAFTKGEQKWDYLYSKDAANIMYLLGEKGKDQNTYCLGSGTARPLKEYIEILRKCVSPEGKIELGKIPYAENQVMYLCADILPIEQDLGYQCQYSFERGIEETYQWIKKEQYNEEN